MLSQHLAKAMAWDGSRHLPQRNMQFVRHVECHSAGRAIRGGVTKTTNRDTTPGTARTGRAQATQQGRYRRLALQIADSHRRVNSDIRCRKGAGRFAGTRQRLGCPGAHCTVRRVQSQAMQRTCRCTQDNGWRQQQQPPGTTPGALNQEEATYDGTRQASTPTPLV